MAPSHPSSEPRDGFGTRTAPARRGLCALARAAVLSTVLASVGRGAVQDAGAGTVHAPGQDAAQAAGHEALQSTVNTRSAAPRLRPAPPPEGPAGWDERVALNRTLSFHERGARAAVELLDGEGARGPSEDGPARAAALYALGAAKASAERTRLESIARLGPLVERRAALLALGTLGSSDGLLVDLALTAEQEVASAAFFGLVLARSPRLASFGAELLEARPELAAQVMAVGTFARDPADQSALANAELIDDYLDLRWRAARDYGLIDGQSWRGLQLRQLATDEGFVDDVVLPSLSLVRHPGVRDHLASLLLERPSPAVFAACLDVLPAELERILARGLFTPPDASYWERALDAIERRGPAPADGPFLELALDVEEFRRPAAAMLTEIGVAAGWEALAPDLASPDADVRAFAVRALGTSEEEDRDAELGRMLADSDPTVQAAAWVGRLRAGERRATDDARAALESDDLATSPLVEEMLRARRAPRVRALLADHLSELEGELQLRAAIELCLPGRLGPREIVRVALERGEAGIHAARAARILADNPTQEEVALLRSLFPRSVDRGFDVAVAQALLSSGEPSGMLFLRAALWRAPWHRSVLAGHLLASQGGVHALHEELDSAPSWASGRDLRRIGFAIGSWGGPQQVEVLARRRASSDPALQGAYLGALSSRTY